MLKKTDILIVSLILAFFIFINLIIVGNARYRGSRGSGEPTYSTYDPDPFGCKAMWLLFERLGYPVSRWKKPFSRLDGEGVLMFCIQPPVFGREDYWDDLREWVERGNVAVFLSASEPFPVEQLGLRYSEAGKSGVEIIPEGSSIYLAGIRKVRVNSRARISTIGSRGGICLKDESGVIALYYPLGKGGIFFGSDPRMCCNKHIGEVDNALFLTNILLADRSLRSVRFNEYIHGYSEKNSLFQVLKGSPAGWALIQLAAGLLLFFYSKGKRFGRVIPINSGEEKRESLDYVSSMAHIYRMGQATIPVFSRIYRGFLKKLGQKLGLRAGMAPPDIIRAVEARSPARYAELIQLINAGEQALNEGKINEPKLLSLSRRMAELEKERL